MCHRSYPYTTLLCWSLLLLVLTSCGTNRKVLYGRGANPSRGSTAIPTDASDARNKSLTGSGINNYAKLMGVSVNELDNMSLYTFIDRWLGSPHHLGGTKPTGIDCSAFVGILYREVYGKNLDRSSRDMEKQIRKKKEKKLQEGDLVFFSFGGRNIDHVGVYLHNHKFVHVSTRKGVIISDMKDGWYRKYFVRAGTPKI